MLYGNEVNRYFSNWKPLEYSFELFNRRLPVSHGFFFLRRYIQSFFFRTSIHWPGSSDSGFDRLRFPVRLNLFIVLLTHSLSRYMGSLKFPQGNASSGTFFFRIHRLKQTFRRFKKERNSVNVAYCMNKKFFVKPIVT